VLWATLKLVDHDRIPGGTTVVRFAITGEPDDHWMLLRRPQSELCTRSLGHVEDLVVHTDAATLVALHLERLRYIEALRSGRLTLEGPPGLVRGFRTWFGTSPFAPYVAPELAPS
jgi:hypothetical protein